jgi:hypothetical protein
VFVTGKPSQSSVMYHTRLLGQFVSYQENEMLIRHCGLYYKHVTIVNDDSRIINKFEALLTDDARVITYNHHVFIVQAV